MTEPTEDAQCDGLHDDGAPDHLLCTVCYPNGNESAPEDDLVDEDIARGESDFEDRP
jgi:hypothetical protein